MIGVLYWYMGIFIWCPYIVYSTYMEYDLSLILVDSKVLGLGSPSVVSC